MNTDNCADIIIIGGGIVGASIALELSKSDKKVILLEANEISSQTSKSSSKMLHGGIRYLENLDFKLVFEALREKNHWLKKKPNLAKESAFYLPVYKESKWPLWAMKFAVFLYNLLSGFKNKKYKSLNRHKFTLLFPMVKNDGLRGAAAYSDAIIDDEFFTIEIANEARSKGVKIIENSKVSKIEKLNSLYELSVNGEIFKSEKIIVAAGPFTDQVAKLYFSNWENIMLPSKGAHLWIKKESLPVSGNMVLQTKDNRIIFIIDHKEKVLVGTTETVLDPNEVQFDIEATPTEIQYILDNVNNYLKNKTLTQDDILSTFSGIRPLVKEGKNSTKTSREHVIIEPDKGFHIIAGGKYTTCRVMAKQMVKKLRL